MKLFPFPDQTDPVGRVGLAVYHLHDGVVRHALHARNGVVPAPTPDLLEDYAVQITWVYPNGDVVITGTNRTDHDD